MGLRENARGQRRPLVRLSLLGGFELRIGLDPATLPMTAQRVLVFLGLQDRPLLRTHVAGSLWPEVGEGRASTSLRSALWRLRRLSQPLVDAESNRLGLSTSVAVDLREGIAVARDVLSSSAPLRQAPLNPVLFHDLLPDWGEEWVLVDRERYRSMRLHALETLVERYAKCGRFGVAAEAAIHATSAEPLRETAHRSLLRVLLAEGNRAQARRHYEVFRRLLLKELGLEPSFELDDLDVPALVIG